MFVDQSRLAINHPEFFYGFIGVTLSWQLAFLIIARDPVKYRLLMMPACLEKLSFAAAIQILYVQKRVDGIMLIRASLDFLLLILFLIALAKSREQAIPASHNS